MRRTNPAAVGKPLLYALLLVATGLVYRATFLSQGFAATDEGWLQALGTRIAHGQLPYRDFDYALPPLSIYKEAALIKLLGDAYGVLASRWAFAVVATLGSVLTYLIIRRYVDDRLAFWTSLPTVFFSVILYYFSNYNYDSLVLLLAAIALLVYATPGRPLFPVLSGVCVGLAILAKPTYGLFLPLLVVAGLVAPRLRRPATETLRGLAAWPLVVVGTAMPIVVAGIIFTVLGTARQFIFQAFFLYRSAHPGSTISLFVQGIPSYVGRPAGLVGLLIVVLLLVRPRRPVLNQLRLGAAIVGLALVLVLTVAFPDRARPPFLVAGFLCLWLINLVALWSGLRGGWPSPELPLFALGLQYMSQITYNGVVLYDVGAYLTVPVALLSLWNWTPHPDPPPQGGRERIPAGGRVSLWLAAAVAVWLILGSVIVTRMNVYEDGGRGQLTSAFRSPKLLGITSLPATTQRIDAAVGAIDRLSRPGEPVFAFPDLAVIYFLTDRPNPTRVDWYNTGSITSDEVTQAVSDLASRRPAVVLLQRYREGDITRSEPIDYQAEPKLDPIFEYLHSHYRQVETAGDIVVLVPQG